MNRITAAERARILAYALLILRHDPNTGKPLVAETAAAVAQQFGISPERARRAAGTRRLYPSSRILSVVEGRRTAAVACGGTAAYLLELGYSFGNLG